MAERKTKYTNADLRREGGPATEYGPWGQTEAGRKRYEHIIGPDSADDIMEGAKSTLRKVQPLKAELNNADRQFRDPTYARAQADASNTGKQFVRGVRESPVSQGAMLAGSVIPSPLQPVFAGGLAAEGAADFAENPGVVSGIGALLSAWPGMSLASKALKGRAAAQEGRQVAEGLFRMGGKSRGSEIPYRAGSGVSTPFPPRRYGQSSPRAPFAHEMNVRTNRQTGQQFVGDSPLTPQPGNIPRTSMQSLVDDVPESFEVVDEGAEFARAQAQQAQPSGADAEAIRTLLGVDVGPPVTKVPRGVSGAEPEDIIRRSGGAFNKDYQMPREEMDALMDDPDVLRFLQMFGR